MIGVMHPLAKFRFCPVCGSSHFRDNDNKSKRCENCGFEYYINPSSAVAAFIQDSEKKLLVVIRAKEPGKGTIDLPGGFCDIGERLEQAIVREVEEETSMHVTSCEYMFSEPNKYRYSDFDIPTLDSFFRCEVENVAVSKADDDASELMWLSRGDIKTELFGLRSIRNAVRRFLDDEDNW